MQEFAFFYPVSKVPATGFTPDEVQLYYARAYLWSAAFLLLYAVEFFCLSAAKLMVLDRVQDFAAVGSDGSISGRSKLGRVVMGIVVVGNFVGLGCNIASASFFKQTADLRLRAAAAYSSNSSAAASDLIALSKQKSQIGDTTASVQYFSEVAPAHLARAIACSKTFHSPLQVAVLIVIIIAFAVVGVTSARLIRSALRRLQLAASQSSFAARGAESSNQVTCDSAHRVPSCSQLVVQVFQLATAAGAEGRCVLFSALQRHCKCDVCAQAATAENTGNLHVCVCYILAAGGVFNHAGPRSRPAKRGRHRVWLWLLRQPVPQRIHLDVLMDPLHARIPDACGVRRVASVPARRAVGHDGRSCAGADGSEPRKNRHDAGDNVEGSGVRGGAIKSCHASSRISFERCNFRTVLPYHLSVIFVGHFAH